MDISNYKIGDDIFSKIISRYGSGSSFVSFVKRKFGVVSFRELDSIVDIRRAEKFLDKDFRTGLDVSDRVFHRRSILNSNTCFRGVRFKAGLPSRGQRTQTNSRTSKNRRKGANNVSFSIKNTKAFKSSRKNFLYKFSSEVRSYNKIKYPFLRGDKFFKRSIKKIKKVYKINFFFRKMKLYFLIYFNNFFFNMLFLRFLKKKFL